MPHNLLPSMIGSNLNFCSWNQYSALQQIGDLSTTSSVKPFNGLYNYSISACLYSPSTFPTSNCQLTGVQIKFQSFTTPYTVNNQEIWIGEVSNSTFPSTTPQVNFSDLTFLKPLIKVKNSFTLTISTNGVWYNFNFDTSYCYSGVGTLLFVWKNYDGSWSSGFGTSDVANVVSKGMYANSDPSFPTGTGTRDNFPLLLKFNTKVNSTGLIWDSIEHYYKFENNLNDYIGTANGIINGSVSYTTGIIGNCISLNGSPNYISFANDSFKPTGDFTIRTWVNLPSLTGINVLLTAGSTTSNGFRFYLNNGIVYFEYNGSFIAVGSSDIITINTWNQIVVSFKSGIVNIYINGQFKTRTTSSTTITWAGTGSNVLYIGRYITNAYYYNGRIDELNLIDGRAWTVADVSQDYNSGLGLQPSSTSTLLNNLVNYYASQNNTNDSLGVSNGTAQGGLTYGAGKNISGFVFNGVNSYITLPSGTMEFTSAFSISFWFKSNSTSTERQMVTNAQKQGGAAGQWKGFQIFTYLSKVYFRLWNTNVNSDCVSTTTLATSTWYHVVCTFSGTSQKVYFNGVLEGTNNSPVTPNYTSPNFPTIGASYYHGGSPYDTGTIFNGTIDEIAPYNYELSSTEVLKLYNGSVGNFYPFINSQ